MTDPIKAEPVAWMYHWPDEPNKTPFFDRRPASPHCVGWDNGWTETPLYTLAQLVEECRLAWNEAIEAALAEVITDQTIDKHGAHCCCTTCELNVAEAGIRALTKDSTHD